MNGSDLGWGINLGTVINAGKHLKFKLQGKYGEGSENYVAHPSPDVGLESNHGDPSKPVKGKALPGWGFFGFTEIEWNDKLKSSLGYSMINIKNSDLQSPDAFRQGHYGLFNLRWYPVNNVLMGIEYQYGKRENFSDGFSSNCNKIQFAFKFNFSQKFEVN